MRCGVGMVGAVWDSLMGLDRCGRGNGETLKCKWEEGIPSGDG